MTPVGSVLGDDHMIRLGLFYPTAQYHHYLVPSLSDRCPDVLDGAIHKAITQTAERCGFDYLFLADTWATHGPRAKELGIVSPHLSAFVLASFLAACSERIGIVNTMHLAYLPPIVVARCGANIDALSNGRWGINMVSGNGFEEGLVPEPARSLDHDQRYDMSEESMAVIRRLWTGERIDHHGAHFELSGELIHPLPVQKPRPLIVSAGASNAGLTLAANHADYLFVPSAGGPPKIQAIRDRLGPFLEAAGRGPTDIKLQTNLVIILRETDEEAQAQAAAWRDAVDLDVAREFGERIAGVSQTYRDIVGNDTSEDEGLRKLGNAGGVTIIAGSARTVADALITYHRDYGIRGFAINLVIWQPSEIQRFADTVMPLLEDAGVWSSPLQRGWTW